MRKLLVLLNKWLVRSLEGSVIFIMAVLVIDVVLQVFTRKILQNPWGWTEELARMLLIWLSLLGAAVGFLRMSHLGVDYFVNKFPPKTKTIVEISVYVLIAFFSASILVYGGFLLVSSNLQTGQLSPALQIEWGYVYLALPVSGLFILIFSIDVIIKKLSHHLKNTS